MADTTEQQPKQDDQGTNIVVRTLRSRHGVFVHVDSLYDYALGMKKLSPKDADVYDAMLEFFIRAQKEKKEAEKPPQPQNTRTFGQWFIDTFSW